MAEQDLFAPPTEQEKALFAPPSPQELKQYPVEQAGEQTGALTSAGLGLVQGATLGFADEIEGGIRAAYNSATDNKEKKDLMSLYQQYRDISRERYQKAKEAHPLAYTAGELGSVALPMGGGIGLASKGIRGALEGTQLLKVAQGAKGLNLAQRIAAGGIEGAGIGAAAGAGTSQADLTKGQVAPLASDVISGAQTGGLVGGALPTVGAAIKGTAGAISGSEYAQGLKRVYERALQGKSTAGVAGAEQTGQELLGVTKELQSNISNKIKEYGQQAIEEYRNNPNITLNANEWLNSLKKSAKEMAKRNGLDPDETNKVLKTIENQFIEEKEQLIRAGKKATSLESGLTTEGEIIEPTITEAKAVKEMPEGFREATPKVTEVEKTVTKPSIERMESHGEAEDVFKTQGTKTTIDYIKDAVMKGELSGEDAQKIVQNLQQAGKFDAATANKITNTLKRVSGEASETLKQKFPGTRTSKIQSAQLHDIQDILGAKGESTRLFTPEESKQVLTEPGYLDFIKKMAQKNEPIQRETEDIVKQKLSTGLGPEKTEELWGKMSQASRDAQIAKSSQKDVQSVASMMAIPKALTYHVPEMAGKAVKSMKDFTKDVMNLTPEATKPLINTLVQKGTPAAKKVADLLSKMSANAKDQSNNALLFTLAQNPAYRQELAEASGTKLESPTGPLETR